MKITDDELRFSADEKFYRYGDRIKIETSMALATELLAARPILRELAKQPCQCAIVMEPGPDGGFVQTSRSQCLYCRARAATK